MGVSNGHVTDDVTGPTKAYKGATLYEAVRSAILATAWLLVRFTYTSVVCKHMKTILSYRMGQKLSSKIFVHIFTEY